VSTGNRVASVRAALAAEDVAEAARLFREYAATLPFDLDFQGFSAELADLPGAYVPPEGGLWLGESAGRVLGCVALRAFAPEVAELKRLYVRPAGRGLGLGRLLTREAIAFARRAGYRCIRLDTLATMHEALTLYRNEGFVTIPAYRFNPIPDTEYLELTL
jgi:ribosomal protein S18 acetylase RimI-like enzyme